jgi:hypothetical protein
MAALSISEQAEAAKLYLSGLSMQQVADHFEVSLHAIVYTLRHQNITRRTSAETNSIRFENMLPSFHLKENLSSEEESLKLAAIMLYWAEGYKVGKGGIDFANSDPAMVIIFCRFLREICGVHESRVRAFIYCYEGQDVEKLHEYWSNLLQLPRSQFTQPYIKAADMESKRGPRMLYGLVHIRYCDKKLLRQVLSWIEEYQLTCVGGRVVNCTSL